MKKFILSLMLGACASAPVMANTFDDKEDAIEYRQSVFSIIAHNFGDMGAMMKGKKPFDAKVFEQRAQRVAALSTMASEGFIKGSESKDSDAKANIWTDQAKFTAQMQQFESDAANLAQAAKSGDKKLIRKAFGPTAKNCKACHDTFKKD